MTTARELKTVQRQRNDLLNQLQSLVIAGQLGSVKGMDYAEVHVSDIAKADRLCKRIYRELFSQPRPRKALP